MSRMIRYAGVLWLIAQLLLGQQFAVAHGIGHAGELMHGLSTEPITHVDDGDEEHTPAHALSHVCTACVATGGLDASLAKFVEVVSLSAYAPPVAATAVSPAPTFATYSPFRGRAPPFFQS